MVYGPLAALEERSRRFGLPDLASLAAGAVDIPAAAVPLGAVSAEGGRAAAAAVLAAVADARAGRVVGLVTAPLHKESLRAAGHPWPGHTELLAEAAGVSDVAMMFVGGGLRVALLTIHRSLRSVPDAISRVETERIVRLVHRELPGLGAERRRIAVCGVNPHAGEHGLFGREDDDVLRPAVATLRGEGIEVTGPLPADTVFVRAAQGEFDAVVAAYHDQGLVPVKLLAFGRAVNVTLGLPFVRTSVDHGTAFDIAAAGTADPGSLLQAMALSVELTRRARTCVSSSGRHPHQFSGPDAAGPRVKIEGVTEDLLPILTRFHREVVLPDMQRLVGGLREELNGRFTALDGHFDAIYQRFDRLETEYQMIVAGLKRVEERLDRVEQRLDKMALKSELLELKVRVDALQGQVHLLEERLGA